MMGTDLVPETSCILNHLTRLEARESFIESCRRESFKSYILYHTYFPVPFYTEGKQSPYIPLGFFRKSATKTIHLNVVMSTSLCPAPI
jgi:hypothetical protein